MMGANQYVWVCLVSAAAIACAVGDVVNPINAAAATLTYDGHGALSAGASSRLLIDYDEPQRSEILDLLVRTLTPSSCLSHVPVPAL